MSPIFLSLILSLLVIQKHFIIIETAVLQNPNVTVPRSKRACTPKLELNQCAKDVNVRFSYYFYYQTLDIELCPNTKRKSIVWTVYDFDRKSTITLKPFENKVVVPMEPGMVAPGSYNMKVTLTDSAGQSVSDECRMDVLSEPPTFLFLNGVAENVLLNEKYKIDLSPSKFYDKKSYLHLKWKVKCVYYKKAECKKFSGQKDCVPEAKGMAFTHSITNPCVSKVEYQVLSKHGAQYLGGYKEVNVVKKETYGVELKCTKNCESAYSDPQRATHLELVCFKNCDGFESLAPTFGVNIYAPKKQKGKLPSDKFKVKGFKAILKPNSLGYSANGIFFAAHKNLYRGMVYFTTMTKEKSPKCTVEPTEGESLVTVFRINCKVTSQHLQMYPPFMSIYQPKSGGTDPTLLAESANLRYKVVVAAIPGQETQRLTYKGHDIFFSEFEGALPPIKVRQTKLTPAAVKKALEKIDQLAKDGFIDRSLQYVQALMQSMDNNKSDKPTEGDAYMKMLASLHSISVDSIYAYKQIGSMIPQLITAKDVPAEFKVKLSQLCSKLSQIQLDQLKKSKYAALQEVEAKSYTGLLRKCTDHLLDKEEDEDDEIRVTTPSEIVSEASVKEDYPNYDNVFVNTQTEEIKQNAMNTILKSSQSVASTLAAGESYRSKNANSDTVVKIESGEDLASMDIKVSGAIVRPSAAQFEKLGDKKVSAMVTSYKSNLLESRTYPLVTHIVDVAFYDLKRSTDKALSDLAVSIIFDVTSAELLKFQSHTMTLPTDRRLWKQPQIDHWMNVHRLNLPKHNYCLIRFEESASDLEVVITRNRRPNYKDFGKEAVYRVNASDAESKIIRCPQWFVQKGGEDAFVYVAILPGDAMLQSSTEPKGSLTYQIQFTRQACMIFDPKETRNWKPAPSCQTGIISTNGVFKFNCTCSHTSLFSGSLSKIHSKLDEVIEVPFHGEPFRNYIIFTHVVVVFLCYLIALCFEHHRRLTEIRKENMFVLSDNLKNDLYCYLILVKTGSQTDAGTTSNVMIQVFGDKSTSKKHVLNYPDPEMRLLQRNNQDCFAMTNNTHLGDLQRIHIWYDNVGLRPSWYCDHVLVLDLQTLREWYFPVEKWLTIRMSDDHEFYSQPSVRTKKPFKNSMNAFFRFYFGGQHLWNIFVKTNDDRITFAQRITVLLSMIYTTYTVNMLYRNPPTFRDSDSYGYGKVNFSFQCVTYGLATSIICSAIHHPFVYVFRNSYKQLDNSTVLTREYRRFSYHVNQTAWCLLITYVVCMMIYLVTFGFWVTFNTSYLWMVTNFFTLVFEAVLVENLYLIVVNVVTATYTKWPTKFFNFALIKQEIEEQRRVLFSSLGEFMMRPYFRQHYRPMNKEELFSLKNYERQRADVKTLFQDLCIFLIYIVLLYIICFTSEDSIVYLSNSHMRKMVETSDFYSDGPELGNIVDVDGIYDYINETIINIVHPVHWYGRYYSVDAGQMIDFNTKLLGVVQLRQQRRVQNCKPPSELKHLKTYCHNPPTIFAKYYDTGENVSSSMGILGYYSGAGYKTTMGRTMYNSYFIMRLLRKNRWIDINTKVFFVEFWTYTANTNVFNTVRIIIERDPSGHFEKSTQVYTMQMIYVNPVTEIVTTVVLVVFISTSLVLTLKRLVQMVKYRRGYWKSAWNVVDFLIVAFSFAAVYFYFAKKRSTAKLLRRLGDADNNEFVDHFDLVSLSLNSKLVSALLICLATIRLWKFLRFGTVFQVMERTLFKASRTLLIVFIYHTTIVLAFAAVILPVYGPSCRSFNNFSKTITTLLLISLNFEETYKGYIKQDKSLYLVIVLYMFVSFFFLTIYSAVLILYLEESQTALSNVEKHYTLKNFVFEESKFLIKSLQREYFQMRLRAGQEDGDPPTRYHKVYPKAPTQRYADVHIISESRLSLMKAAATCVVRATQALGGVRDGTNLTEADFKRMAKVYLGLVLPPPKEDKQVFFFSSQDPKDEQMVKFVPDERLLQMEYVTRKLVEDDFEAGAGDMGEDTGNVVMGVSGVAERLEVFRDCISLIKANIDNIKITSKKKS